MSQLGNEVRAKGTLAAALEVVTIDDTFGATAVSCQITGTFTGLTVTFQGSNDGTNWVSLLATPVAGGASGSTASAVGIYLIYCPGVNSVRALCSAIATGSAAVVLHGSFSAAAVAFGVSGGVTLSRAATSISVDAQVQAALYATGDLVGEKLTFANAVPVSGGSCYVRGATIRDQAFNPPGNSAYDLVIFNSDPTGTTFTDNAPLDIADADMAKILTVIRFGGVGGVDHFPFVDNVINVAATDQLGDLLIASGSTSLFGAVVARAAPTYAAITDVFVALLLEQN